MSTVAAVQDFSPVGKRRVALLFMVDGRCSAAVWWHMLQVLYRFRQLKLFIHKQNTFDFGSKPPILFLSTLVTVITGQT
jgi:hypothetical protein